MAHLNRFLYRCWNNTNMPGSTKVTDQRCRRNGILVWICSLMATVWVEHAALIAERTQTPNTIRFWICLLNCWCFMMLHKTYHRLSHPPFHKAQHLPLMVDPRAPPGRLSASWGMARRSPRSCNDKHFHPPSIDTVLDVLGLVLEALPESLWKLPLR